MNDTQLHLASSSPRRRQILGALGVRYTYAGVNADEQPRHGETAAKMVLRLALVKAEAARDVRGGDIPILGADTAVVLGDRILGKPMSKAAALDMLSALSGRTHTVLTAVTLLCGRAAESALSSTEVRFREIRPDEALRYWHSGEPEGKAGAYAVQGLGGVFVEHLAGSYSGVVGLPVFETCSLLRKAGVDVIKPAVEEAS